MTLLASDRCAKMDRSCVEKERSNFIKDLPSVKKECSNFIEDRSSMKKERPNFTEHRSYMKKERSFFIPDLPKIENWLFLYKNRPKTADMAKFSHAKPGPFEKETRPAYRSHSPITKSREPRMATTSLIMWPGRIFGRMERFTKDGARIFSRCGVPPPLLAM